MPSLSNSPRMRSAPQRGLRAAISRMSAALPVGGRPDCRERRRQNARNPARCQRRMVAVWMSRVASRQAGATRAARTIMKRCQRVHRTRPAIFRPAAMSCCRRSAFSATSSARRRTRSTASPKRTEEGRSRVESYIVHARMEFVARTTRCPSHDPRKTGVGQPRAVRDHRIERGLLFQRLRRVEQLLRFPCRSPQVLISILPEIVWNGVSDGSSHRITKKFCCWHWTKRNRAIYDESFFIFFNDIQTFEFVTLNFPLPPQ